METACEQATKEKQKEEGKKNCKLGVKCVKDEEVQSVLKVWKGW